MALEQQYNSQDRGIQMPIPALADFGRHVQEIASEMTKISQENLEAGTTAAQKLRDVKGLPDVIAIQADLVKSTFQTLGAHYPRIVAIAAATPVALVASLQEALGKVVEAGKDTVREVSDTAREASDKTLSVVEESSDAALRTFDRTAQAERSGS